MRQAHITGVVDKTSAVFYDSFYRRACNAVPPIHISTPPPPLKLRDPPRIFFIYHACRAIVFHSLSKQGPIASYTFSAKPQERKSYFSCR